MVVKSQIRLIKSLQQKKYRNEHGLFVVEGIKVIKELLNADMQIAELYCSDAKFLSQLKKKPTLVSEVVLRKMSSMHTPNGILGVFHTPKPSAIHFSDWILVLDSVRDPGNLGTIIRLADWYGIEHVVCSPDTVDAYNPKVLQATMGSIARINITYTDLVPFLSGNPLPIYGAYMTGTSVYTIEMPKKGILILGNEANGISNNVNLIAQQKISIPQYGSQTAESLNVAMAAGILLSELRRK